MKKRRHLHSTKRPELATLAGRLRESSHKVTGPRRAILEILRMQSRPLTGKEILAAMRRGQCDLATIYRAMHLLEKMQLVKRVDFGDGSARFELADEEHGAGHHHHLVCTRCDTVVEIQECFLRELEDRLGAANGFAAVTHKLEFFGICPQCQKRSR